MYSRICDLVHIHIPIPMILTEEYFDAHPQVIGLHHALCISLDRARLLLIENYTTPDGEEKHIFPTRGQKWSSQLQILGFSRAEAFVITNDAVCMGSDKLTEGKVLWFLFSNLEVPRVNSETTALVQRTIEGRNDTPLRLFHSQMIDRESWAPLKFKLFPAGSQSDSVSPALARKNQRLSAMEQENARAQLMTRLHRARTGCDASCAQI